MRLFTLPDQSKMEVEVLLHETVVQRLHPQLPASIRVEALPDETLEGDLTAIAPVPVSDQSQDFGNGVPYFLGHVRLDTLPPRLRPGMTAEVNIATGLRKDVLAVPSTSVMVEDDQEICYVNHDDSVERRPVKVSQGDEGLLEVVEGLDEGEQVVVDPSQVDLGSSR